MHLKKYLAVIVIKDRSGLLRVPAEALHIAQVTVGNLLPMTIEKPSAITTRQAAAGLVSEAKWISQHLQASLGKVVNSYSRVKKNCWPLPVFRAYLPNGQLVGRYGQPYTCTDDYALKT